MSDEVTKDVEMDPEENIVTDTETQPENDIIMETSESEEAIVMESSENSDEPEESAEISGFSFYNEDKSEDIDDQISIALTSLADEMIDTAEPAGRQDDMGADEDKEFSIVNAALASQFGDNEEEEEVQQPVRKKRRIIPIWLMVSLCIVFGIALTGGLLVGTSGGQTILSNIIASIISGKVEFDDGKDVTPIPDNQQIADNQETNQDNPNNNPTNTPESNPGENNNNPSLTPTPTITPNGGGTTGGNDNENQSGMPRKEEGIYNILLLGEEAMETGGGRGRTDAIMLATLDTVNNKVKITSFARDTLVYIQGYNDNILNSVYSKGGIQLLYKVMEQNFDIKIDGYVLVGFDNFEDIVDAVGGVDITLTEEEAEYLRTTNYISEEKYRTVVAGVNHMNGNQVLGYCRIRKVGTSTGEGFDFGRTSRHRIVLNAIFEKCKELNMLELTTLMWKMLNLDNLKTDITENMWSQYLKEGMNVLTEAGELKLEELRVPLDGTYEFGSRTQTVIVDGVAYEENIDYIIINRPKTIELLHEFIFGDYIE